MSRSMRFFLAVLAVLSAAAIAVFVPRSVPVVATRFDLVGGIGFAVGLFGVVLAISQGPVWGWTSPWTALCGVGGPAWPTNPAPLARFRAKR